MLVSFFLLNPNHLFGSLGGISAAVEVGLDNAVPVTVGSILTLLFFFIKRMISQTDKSKENWETESKDLRTKISEATGRAEVLNTDIRLINKELGRLESSENKQWTTHDAHVRELAELKTRIAILESKLD